MESRSPSRRILPVLGAIAARPRVLLIAGLVLLVAGCGQEQERPPLDPLAQRYLVLGSQALGQWEYPTALAWADSARAQAPGAPDPYMLQGRIYAEMNDLARSDSFYEEVIRLDPHYPGVWNNLGNNAIRRQDYTGAIGYYHREIEANPAPIPWRGIGRAYVELGKVDSAAYAFEQAIRQDSTYAPAYFSLALLLEDEGEDEEALVHARRAVRLSPDDYDFKYVMAELMVKTGRYEEAIPHLLDVAEFWPWHHPAHYNLGQALARAGEPELAQRALARAEELRALDAEISQQMNAIRAVPDDPLSHAALGSAMRMAGRNEEALRAYRIAAQLDPSNLDVRNNIANLHLVLQDTTAALEQYRDILRQDPSFVDVWVNMGIVLAIAGRTDEARQAWEAALQRDPRNERARTYLARL